MDDKLIKREREKWVKEFEASGVVKSMTMNAQIRVQKNSMISVGLIVERVLDEVASKSLSAGLGGHHHDGGARELMKALRAWVDGFERTTPPSFGTVMLAIQKEQNPDEYEEYLRLKKVFGD